MIQEWTRVAEELFILRMVLPSSALHKHVCWLPAFGSHHLLADHEKAKQEAAVVKSSRSCWCSSSTYNQGHSLLTWLAQWLTGSLSGNHRQWMCNLWVTYYDSSWGCSFFVHCWSFKSAAIINIIWYIPKIAKQQSAFLVSGRQAWHALKRSPYAVGCKLPLNNNSSSFFMDLLLGSCFFFSSSSSCLLCF